MKCAKIGSQKVTLAWHGIRGKPKENVDEKKEREKEREEKDWTPEALKCGQEGRGPAVGRGGAPQAALKCAAGAKFRFRDLFSVISVLQFRFWRVRGSRLPFGRSCPDPKP